MVLCMSLLSAFEAAGQTTPACRVLCAPEFKVEPTVTFTNLFGSPPDCRQAGNDDPRTARN